jgi:carboxypeptidase Taq
MIPFLKKTLELSQEYASFFAPYDHIADPMIDDADEGLTTATVQRVFADLRRELVPMVRAICDQPPADDRCLHQSFAEATQLEFGRSVAVQMGYDLERGRLDKTHHPFCTKFGAGDVRITTRVRENDIRDALFSTLHEAGHAMYEQAMNAGFEGTPLGSGASSGRTWLHAAGCFGNIIIRPFNEYLPINSDWFRSTLFITPSTRWSARSSEPTLTK